VRELLVGEKGAELIEGPAGRLRMTEPTYTRVGLAVNALTELERSQRLSIVSASQWMRAWERGEHALIGLEEQVRALHGERPVLVIIDTLATLEVQPMNENPRYESDLDMDADIVTALKRWKVALPTGSAILAVHEEGKAATGKGDGHSVRGSSKYLYSSDQRWTLVYADQLNGTRKKKKREREPSDDVTEVDLHLVKARRGGKANVVIALDHEHGKGAIREVGRFTVRELIGKDKPAETDDAPDELTNDAGPAFKSRRPKRKKVKA
jgi:hypothetical protein